MKGRIVVFVALVLATLAASARPADQPWVEKTYSGAVEIRRGVTPEVQLIVAIDSVRGGVRDGFADVAYVFYSEGPAPDFRFQAEHANVEDIGGKQLVIVANGQHLVFAIGDETPVKRSENAFVFANGVGLARYWGDHVSGMRVAANDGTTAQVGCGGEADGGECYSDWSLGSGGGGSSCSSGGRGSTSCSIEATVMNSGGACSVSCQPGYYACCTYSSGCFCVKN
jgi:hypothetical protein